MDRSDFIFVRGNGIVRGQRMLMPLIPLHQAFFGWDGLSRKGHQGEANHSRFSEKEALSLNHLAQLL